MLKMKYLVAFIGILAIGCTERAPGADDGGVVEDLDVKDDIDITKDGPKPPPPDGPKPPPPDMPLPPPPDMPLPPPPDMPVPPPPDGAPPPPPDGPGPKPDMPLPPDQAVPVPDGGPLTNATCAKAKSVAFNGTKVTFTGTTSGNANEYGTSVNCGSYTSVMSGSQAYYKVKLTGKQNYRFSLKPAFHYARFYIFNACGAASINSACSSQGKTGAVSAAIYSGYTGIVLFTPPSSGTYYVAVDSTNPSYGGTFSMTIEKYSVPTNFTCAKALTLTLKNKVASVNGTTVGASNEFGTSINCGSYTATYPGNQAYYKLNMLKGHTYKITLKPTFYAVIYVFRSVCNAKNINADCGSKCK